MNPNIILYEYAYIYIQIVICRRHANTIFYNKYYTRVCVLQACLRHPDSSEASQNRDTVFCQMRRAMDLIHYVVKDGVKEGGGESMALTPYISEQDGGDTLGHALNVLDSFVDMTRYI